MKKSEILTEVEKLLEKEGCYQDVMSILVDQLDKPIKKEERCLDVISVE